MISELFEDMFSRKSGSIDSPLDDLNWYSSHTNPMIKSNTSQEERLERDMIDRRQRDPFLTEGDDRLEVDNGANPRADAESHQPEVTRVEAENRITEILEDLYSSLNVRQNADDILALAEIANRETKAANDRVTELEDSLAAAREDLHREIEARQAAQRRAKEGEEDLDRVRSEYEDAQARLEEEKRAREEALAMSKEIEAWSQEIGVKWLEEADARQAAERRITEIETELKRVQSIIGESEAAWDGFGAQREKEAEERDRIERLREAAENREKIALRAKEEAEALASQLESHLKKIDPGFLSDLKTTGSGEAEGRRPGRREERSSLFEPIPPPSAAAGQPPQASGSASLLSDIAANIFSKANNNLWVFILMVVGALLFLIYIMYRVLK